MKGTVAVMMKQGGGGVAGLRGEWRERERRRRKR
jgi:hypothetical protein